MSRLLADIAAGARACPSSTFWELACCEFATAFDEKCANPFRTEPLELCGPVVDIEDSRFRAPVIQELGTVAEVAAATGDQAQGLTWPVFRAAHQQLWVVAPHGVCEAWVRRLRDTGRCLNYGRRSEKRIPVRLAVTPFIYFRI